MIPLEKSEAETRERGAVLSPSCAQRKCIFFVAQRGSASRGRRSPFCKKLFATLGPFLDVFFDPKLRAGARTDPPRVPAFSSSLLCLFSPYALTPAVTGPCLAANATATPMRRQAPSATPNSRPRRRLHVMHAAARRGERPHSVATAGVGRRFENASSFSIPIARNALSRGSSSKRRMWTTSSLTGDAQGSSSTRRICSPFAMSATRARRQRKMVALGTSELHYITNPLNLTLWSNQDQNDEVDEVGQRNSQVSSLLSIEVDLSRVRSLIPNDPASPKNIFHIRRKFQALDPFVKGISFPAKVGNDDLEAQAKKGACRSRRFSDHCLRLAEDFSRFVRHVGMGLDAKHVWVDHLTVKPNARLITCSAECCANTGIRFAVV